MSDIVISVENVSKKYVISHQQSGERDGLRHALDNLFRAPWRFLRSRAKARRQEREEFWALRDVTFNVNRGDVLGIVGRNGAGKSTLLKILSRATEPTFGRIHLKGRVASLLEVGTGFHPELTGRENVFLNGSILGMSKAEIRSKFDEIVAFSEIEKFLDTPVKRYSSGMYVRLAFAVAAHLQPEILLLDEVLAVGDAAFQKKCLGKMQETAKSGRTILFVSHSTSAVRNLCTSCIWLEQGVLKMQGATISTLDTYLKHSLRYPGAAHCVLEEDLQREFQVVEARLLDQHGTNTRNFICDEPVMFELKCKVRVRVPGLYGYLVVARTDGTLMLEADSYDPGTNPVDDLPPGEYLLRVVIPPRTLGHGEYTIYLNFGSHQAPRGFNVDTVGTILSFQLEDPTSRRGNNRDGFLSTLTKWELQPAHRPAGETAPSPLTSSLISGSFRSLTTRS
jgi:lipopolysaccharide transport system ATP-binding protein